MGVGGSKGGGGVGSSKSAGSRSSGTGTIENRQVTRKAKKEDLFTIATYSILPESRITDAMYPYWQKKDRKAKRRQPQLLAELQALSASVVCLQAVEGELYDQFLKPELGKLGYEGAFLKLSGKKDASVKIGVATFFHSRTFRLLKTHNVKLNDVAKEAGKAARVEARGARLLNGSGALCLLLQLLPDKHAKQHCVVVANAQLSAEEGHPDVQALEAALLLKELQGYAEHVQEFKTSAGLTEVSVGYLLAGDLGAGPKSPQHGLLKHGRLDLKEERKLRKCQQVTAGKGMGANSQPLIGWFASSFSHNWGSLKSAYASVVGAEPPYTVFTDQARGVRDYVWYTGDNLNANSALHVTDQALVAQMGGLPNARFPSDHLPLCFGFRFKKSDAFTTMLPFDGQRGEGAASQDGAEEGDPDGDLGPRDLDDILGFKTPTDNTRYDRFGYERGASGIAAGDDLKPDVWQAAKSKRYA